MLIKPCKILLIWTAAAYYPGDAIAQTRWEGRASFYGAEFSGEKTASGEIFDPRLATAAHRTLSFGTVLKVTNKQNGRTVTVRVNDRGPALADREIDLSEAAAKKLEMKQDGVTHVMIEKLVRP